MGRKPRVEDENGIFHVIQRGNNREFIFKEEIDKNYLIGQIMNLSRDMGFKIYGYTIMGNHYHLIIQVHVETLKSVMHRINLRYSKYFNREYGRTGHVFEGRYKAIPVKDEKYLLSLIRYVHQNSVRASVCGSVEEYSWSSDRFYRENINDWVEIGLIMDMLSSNRRIAVKRYKEFMADEEAGEFEKVKLIGETSNNQKISESISKKDARNGLDEILLATGVEEKEFELIKRGSRKRNLTEYKLLYAKEALKVNYTLKEIGNSIQVSDAAILDMLKRHNLIT